MNKIYAPLTYWNAPKHIKEYICNGCGSKDGIKVPNTMYGLDISQACNIHDWMWEFGNTKGDLFFSNAIFIMNLTIIIISNSNWITSIIRLMRATKYFIAVMKFGTSNYWKNKVENELMNITYKGEFRNE